MFTTEEFNIMLEEMLGGDMASHDMLCTILEKSLRPAVNRWCRANELLYGQADDIMQEIHARIIKTCIPFFLLREDMGGRVNNDPEGFRKWIFTVARNITQDYLTDLQVDDNNLLPIEDGAEVPDSQGAIDAREAEAARIETLKKAFSIAIDADAKVYIVLTWLAQSILMIDLDVSKIRSNDLIVEKFERMTLAEMYGALLLWAERIPWLTFTDRQNDRICAALEAPYDGTRTYGEVEYRTFFMKKGGKASISDWVNRMNNRIMRGMGNGSSDS